MPRCCLFSTAGGRGRGHCCDCWWWAGKWVEISGLHKNGARTSGSWGRWGRARPVEERWGQALLCPTGIGARTSCQEISWGRARLDQLGSRKAANGTVTSGLATHIAGAGLGVDRCPSNNDKNVPRASGRQRERTSYPQANESAGAPGEAGGRAGIWRSSKRRLG
ncbi:unnamed protein product [Pylaiella littoralis]